MGCNTEMLESIINEWTKNLYMLYHMDTGKSPQDLFKEFHVKFYSDDTRGLNRLQQISEQSFILMCNGLSYLPKKLEYISSEKSLVGAWRRSVLRNHYQQHFNFFIECMEKAEKKYGIDAVARECPSKEKAVWMLSALDEMKYKSSEMSRALLKSILHYIALNENPAHNTLKP